MKSDIKSKVFTSLMWKLLERGGVQGIQFIIQIILARILTPNDYGIIAIITIFISLANVFIQSGFGTALIQKKEIDEKDLSSVFYLSLIISVVIYLILFITAPLIANFYKIAILKDILRVLSLTLFLGTFNSIQNVIIIKNLEFKKMFIGSIGAATISGIISIIMVYNNFGIWTLVYQQLINQTMLCIILYFIVKWRPKILFSFTKVKALFSFGSKILFSSLLDTLYMNLRSLIIGKFYSPTMLGYYNRGDQFPLLIVSNFNGSIQSVIFPVFVQEQDNKVRLKELLRRSIVTGSFVIFPLMIGLAIVGEPLVKLLLTEKWTPCVPYLRVFCLSYALWPIHTANLQVINAMGRSDIFLKLEIIKKIIGIIILIVSLKYGVYMIAVGTLLGGIISSFVNSFPNKKILDYGYIEQMRDIFPSIGISLIMGGIIYPISLLKINLVSIIFLQILLGMIVYILIAYLIKLECLSYLIKIVFKNQKN
ncbi:lipopolysaccharide biosynthesis protein [Cetobacterium sp. 8H]|uniref:lipopolysaccharide biosynthesis protein n=1 Tax=Cetobacterium sp. 8H TaxID=2759681 RepID=UPI00163BB976|nr:lipopolysaccharide biosynthesis protein [Cetobacterium sp. 8H]MBC2850904.1 lipopolysaccharide biosynthesis protein [Cetobacterium sp. 8H]